MAYLFGYTNDFERNKVIEKMDELDSQLIEEQSKEPENRNLDREFELLYAKFIAGLRLNTGARLY